MPLSFPLNGPRCNYCFEDEKMGVGGKEASSALEEETRTRSLKRQRGDESSSQPGHVCEFNKERMQHIRGLKSDRII